MAFGTVQDYNVICLAISGAPNPMKSSLIVGMGIGKLYASVLESLGHEIVTVDTDPTKGADYTVLEDALIQRKYDTAHICTPNYTHESVAKILANHSQIIFVEKPGFQSAKHWGTFNSRHPNTRIMMVKNNQWRSDFQQLRDLAAQSEKISINWINHDRVPNPGSWFTNCALAWGGVSRDLLPHLLSIFLELDPSWIGEASVINKIFRQRWRLCDISSSDYGSVDSSGVYDVDDYAGIVLELPGTEVSINADWRSNTLTDIGVRFHLRDGSQKYVPLGLCPEEAYKNMISDALENQNNHAFWNRQYEQDIWIHRMMENS